MFKPQGLMDVVKGKWKKKKNLISKAWERCLSSFGAGNYKRPPLNLKAYGSKPPSLSENNNKGEMLIAPDGFIAVYVGPQKQRFVVKTEFVNHPLFKILLEEAEMEYGFKSDGPIWLPCNVDLFYKVLAEMDATQEAKGYSSFFVLRSPARLLCYMNSDHDGAYCRVMDSEMIKLNRFQ